MTDFEYAKDKVLMGVERKSMVISLEERRNTAYHEAGHTFVTKMLPKADPIHKVTIIPRGRALGVTQQLPEDDRHTYDKGYLSSQIAVLMGGRAAEEIFLDHMTTGAGNDIERATELARKMVCEWGMSEKLGPLTFGRKEEQIFLGKEFSRHRDFSEETALNIDSEIRRTVMDGYNEAKRILMENQETVKRLAEVLLERESLDAAQIQAVIDGKDLPNPDNQRQNVSPQGPDNEAGTATSESITPSVTTEPNPEKI